MDAERLLVKLSLGQQLEEEELDGVLELLRRVNPGAAGSELFAEDIYGAVLVLGRAQAKSHHQLIARHLDGSDPQTVSLILEVLCLQWGMTEDYIEWVFRFAVGASWDSEEDVRRTAVKILGEYLRERFASQRDHGRAAGKRGEPATNGASDPWRARNGELLELLFSIFEDADADPFTRQAAYGALLRVAGKAWEELPSEYGLMAFGDASPDIDRGVMNRLRERRAS